MKKLILFLSFQLFIGNFFSQKTNSIIAALKDTIESWGLVLNGKVYYTVKKGDVFYYYPSSQTACTVNGKAGKIPADRIKQIDTLNYIRYSYTEKDLNLDDSDEDLLLANSKGLEYKELISKAINKDEKALKELLTLEKQVDGAAAEIFGRASRICSQSMAECCR